MTGARVSEEIPSPICDVADVSADDLGTDAVLDRRMHDLLGVCVGDDLDVASRVCIRRDAWIYVWVAHTVGIFHLAVDSDRPATREESNVDQIDVLVPV